MTKIQLPTHALISKYEGKVFALREQESDVIIVTPREATPARLQIDTSEHMAFLKKAEAGGLSVQAWVDSRSGVILALKLPPKP
jgi:hypothetical protein